MSEYVPDDEARKENNALGEIRFHGRPLPSTPRRPVTLADLTAFPSPFAHNHASDSVGAMSEYVPDDDEVRDVWRDAMTQPSEYFDALSPAEADKRFNAWMQAHDARIAREAAERAWDEGHTAGYQDAQAHHGQGVTGAGCGPDSWDCDCPNPYRQRDNA